MNFNWLLDGSIVGLYLVATMAAGIMVRKYVGNVEQFLVAGREMNVFLGIASLAATEFGIVTCMYTAQGGYSSGFAGATYASCSRPRNGSSTPMFTSCFATPGRTPWRWTKPTA